MENITFTVLYKKKLPKVRGGKTTQRGSIINLLIFFLGGGGGGTGDYKKKLISHLTQTEM